MEYVRKASYTTKETVIDMLIAAIKEVEQFPGEQSMSFGLSISEQEKSESEYNAGNLARAAVEIAQDLPSFAEDVEQKERLNRFVDAHNVYGGRRLPRVVVRRKK